MKLTLDKSWELCLKQWRWIAKQIKAESHCNVGDLKRSWMEIKGFRVSPENVGDDEICSNCFFCEYDIQHTKDDPDCQNCPAKKIDKKFVCMHTEYDYIDYPLKFYAKLLELNRKRKKK